MRHVTTIFSERKSKKRNCKVRVAQASKHCISKCLRIRKTDSTATSIAAKLKAGTIALTWRRAAKKRTPSASKFYAMKAYLMRLFMGESSKAAKYWMA